MNKRILLLAALVAICLLVLPDAGWAADTASSSGYLSGYETQDPHPTAISWWSTLAYFLSILVIFAFVVGMAYLAARFLGGHFGRSAAQAGGRVLVQLPLGPKSSISAVEIAGKVLLLGVTEANVSLLTEVKDPDEIEALERASTTLPQRMGTTMFSSQLGTLADIAARFRKS